MTASVTGTDTYPSSVVTRRSRTQMEKLVTSA